ncbi:hypothetical protein LXM25_15350 [Dyadobacter sp. LJ53]|uniref:hypothetical protein n=1 Tax=Dyadobacter chenwenxiniae TaxID=2906456 RepID=UPI001F2A356D|nr:hypothetical protein [Dyadobacter chenwenxiniae]MCF0051446.1 hypothetical protein [Dyadobacter chenwenxiniae]
MIRSFALTVLLSAVFFSVNGQDILVKKNGATIEGKVTEVGIDRVSYKISQEKESASFVIRKNELNRIEFANGQTVFIDERNLPGKRRVNPASTSNLFGRHMVNFSPFKALDSGPGLGLSYEILADKKGYFGIILPVSLIFPDRFDLFDGYGDQREAFYFSPGLKIYPFGQKRVTYAVGPSIFTGFGKQVRNDGYYDPNTGTYPNTRSESKIFRFGIIVNNYVNFQISDHFQIGLNGGFGSRYIDRETYNDTRSTNGGINITGEFNFNLGLRF